MDVLIFRTNATNFEDYRAIKNSLFSLPSIYDCTIDLGDCDKVLRVVTENMPPEYIKLELEKLGYLCEELED